jgi:hypothetical protein
MASDPRRRNVPLSTLTGNEPLALMSERNMTMPSLSINRWIIGTAFAALVAIVLVACGGGDSPQAQQEEERATALSVNGNADGSAKRGGQGDSKGHATNTPRRIDQTILAGASTTLTVALVATDAAQDTEVWVSPELRPYVVVVPLSFGPLREGQSVQIQLTINAPLSALPTMATGTVHLRDVDIRKRARTGQLITHPLPVVLRIVPRRFTNDAGHYAITVPPDWQVEDGVAAPSSTILRAPGKTASAETEYVGDIFVSVRQNPSNLTLSNYYRTVSPEDLFAASAGQVLFTIGGFEAIRFVDVGGMLPSTIVAIRLNGRLVEFTDYGNSHQGNGLFHAIVSTFSIVP